MDRKTENAILRLRKAGATKVMVGNVTVEFGEAPTQAQQKTPVELAQDELDQLREDLMDQREVEGIQAKVDKKKKLERLKYAHS